MNILVAVTGSIAAYKAYDIVRSLSKNGHNIKVVLTKGALEFVQAKTFRYLGALATYQSGDDFKTDQEGIVPHITLRDWADKLLIAPCSANTLSKFAHASSDDLLSSLFVAWDQKKPILIFPAMNTQMLSHPFVDQNIEKVKTLSCVHVFSTQTGELICGEEGNGKMLSTEAITDLTLTYANTRNRKKVLISAGASRSPLDPIRYLTNPASGRSGYELAKYFLKSGWEVLVVHGPKTFPEFENLQPHPNFSLISGTTTSQMGELILNHWPNFDLYISTAAFCDIEFSISPQKLKKASLQGSIDYTLAPDILSKVIACKSPHQKVIGYAAETELTEELIKEKWRRKPVDLLIANEVNGQEPNLKGFAVNSNDYTFFDGKNFNYKELTKDKLGPHIEELIN